MRPAAVLNLVRVLGCAAAVFASVGATTADAQSPAQAEERKRAEEERKREAQQRKDAQRDAREKGAADMAAALADSKQLGSSCADIAMLEKKANAPGLTSTAKTFYIGAANGRRLEQTKKLESQIRGSLGLPHTRCDSTQDIADARAGIPAVKTSVDQLRCYDAARATALDAEVQKWVPSTEAAIADDEKCLAVPGCLPKRIAQEDICPRVARRAEILAEIAKAKQYGQTTGVVNAKDLYDFGEELKSVDEDIARGRAHYASVAKKPFGGTCPKP